MFISFLIPSYNHCKYISQTLDSIVDDIGTDDLIYEIILIDDGSTDTTKDCLDVWRSSNPNISCTIIYRENRGLCRTLNELVNISSGDILRLCASDDKIFPGSTRKIIETFRNENCLVLVGDALVIDDDNNIVNQSAISQKGGNVSKLENGENFASEVISNWSIPGPCFCLKRKIYDVVGYYSEDLHIEDWDFFLRVAALCEVKYCNYYFSYYRIHNSNVSITKNSLKQKINIRCQLIAGWRQLYLFSGYLKLKLFSEILKLGMKFIYYSIKVILK